MHFLNMAKGWYCQFLMDDLKTPLRRKLTFQEPEKIFDLAKRGGAEFTSADRQALEYGIQMGRGAVWLNLTKEQMDKLR
jgi:hypothetical protein